jgi:hypothetical protein
MESHVRTVLQLLVAALAAMFVAAAAFAGTVWLAVATDPCDTAKYVCDGAVYGGIGLGALLGAAAGCAAAVWVFLALRQRRRPSRAAA